MSLADSYILGKHSDLLDPDLTQEEVNEKSLFIYDQEELIRKTEVRISKYELDFLINSVKEDSPREFWLRVLKKLIKKYFLNSLKSLLNDEYPTFNQRREIIDLLIFMKTKMPMIVKEKKIDQDIERNRLKEIMNEVESPDSIRYALKYIDKTSLNRFVKEIIKESKQDYED